MAAANHSNKSSVVDKGCFAIYSMNKRHLVIPYSATAIFHKLLKMSEEEFGLPSDGLIALSCDSVIMNHVPCEMRIG
ncbi:hypothetical protein V6N13_090167 [Hibiscus sabdariffa]|uniref:Uncharacterized protein n=1 Tax=Hibiscus sabdariffa TaxID=183260 RepID=A0ABR2QI65_9ROSI